MQNLKYYVKSVYGCDKEYLHPDNGAMVNDTITSLIANRKTITPEQRQLLSKLMNRQWQQMLPPAITH